MNTQIEYLSDDPINAAIVADAREFVHAYSDDAETPNNIPSRIYLSYDSEQNFREMCKALGIPKFQERDGKLFLPWSDVVDVERVRQKLLDSLDCFGPNVVDMHNWTMDRVRACDSRIDFLKRRAQREERRSKMEFVNPAGDKVGDKRPAKFLAKKAAKSAESQKIRAQMKGTQGGKK